MAARTRFRYPHSARNSLRRRAFAHGARREVLVRNLPPELRRIVGYYYGRLNNLSRRNIPASRFYGRG